MDRWLETGSRLGRSCNLLGREINRQVERKKHILGKNKEILDAELWAISEALDIAEKIANPRTPVTILSDSQKALRAIALPFTSQENCFLRSHVYQKMEELQRTGHPTIFQWVPGHSGLIGNEKANLCARNRAERGGKLTERWSSLAYIKKMCIVEVRHTAPVGVT